MRKVAKQVTLKYLYYFHIRKNNSKKYQQGDALKYYTRKEYFNYNKKYLQKMNHFMIKETTQIFFLKNNINGYITFCELFLIKVKINDFIL